MAMVHIITDGGGSFGLGHLRRSASLAWALKRAGYAVEVRTAVEENMVFLPEVPHDQGAADVVVVDLPYSGDEWLREARRKGAGILGLDYRGNDAPDVLVAIVDRGFVPDCLNRHIGLPFAIIRQDVEEAAPCFNGEGVLVSIGGGDQQGLGPTVAENLANEGCDVTLIVGPVASSKQQVQSDSPPSYRCFTNPDNYSELIGGCSWAVTNGGATMMEMMCMGKAVYVLPQTENERELAHIVADQGGVLGVGIDSVRIPSEAETQSVGSTARRLVDGRGLDRIVAEIGKLI